MLIVGNGKVITRDSDLPFMEQGAVAIEGTRIAQVGHLRLAAAPQRMDH